MGKYTWDAQEYAENSAPQQAWGSELMKKLQLTGQEHILDLGCGDGRNSAKLAKLTPDGLSQIQRTHTASNGRQRECKKANRSVQSTHKRTTLVHLFS